MVSSEKVTISRYTISRFYSTSFRVLSSISTDPCTVVEGAEKSQNDFFAYFGCLGMGKHIKNVLFMNSIKILGFQEFEVWKFLWYIEFYYINQWLLELYCTVRPHVIPHIWDMSHFISLDIWNKIIKIVMLYQAAFYKNAFQYFLFSKYRLYEQNWKISYITKVW